MSWLRAGGDTAERSPCLGYRAVLSRYAGKGLAPAGLSVTHPAALSLPDSLLPSQRMPVPIGLYAPAQAQLAGLFHCPHCQGIFRNVQGLPSANRTVALPSFSLHLPTL